MFAHEFQQSTLAGPLWLMPLGCWPNRLWASQLAFEYKGLSVEGVLM